MHPPPQADETLSSWLTRVTRGNGSSLSSWMAAFDGNYRDPATLDTVEDAPLWNRIARAAGLATGAEAIRDMTLLELEQRFQPHAASRWFLSLAERSEREGHGYCPVCLANDEDPYLRRAWRIEWARWCAVHQRPLERECRSCGAALAPWKAAWHRPFTQCWNCEQDLALHGQPAQGSAEVPPPFVLRATAEALVAAHGNGPAWREGSPFPAVWCLQKWVERLGRERWPAWVVDLDLGSAVDASPPVAEDLPVWSFALAWHLATGPRERLARLAHKHQATFNRATANHCPMGLAPLRRALVSTRPLHDAEVEAVVVGLVDDDLPVTYLAVAEALGVDAKRIAGNVIYRGIVDRAEPAHRARRSAAVRVRLANAREALLAVGQQVSRANLAKNAGLSLEAIARFEAETGETYAISAASTYVASVQQAIEELRSRGVRVTSVGVAERLGRERTFIEKNEELKQMVQAARDAKPTPDEVRRACVQLREQDEVIRVGPVARLLGRGREVIERNPPLRAIVREEANAQQRVVEEKIRHALERLAKRGERLSVAGVCRELGLHRSYVEKRGRLREIVEQRQRPSKPSAPRVSASPPSPGALGASAASS